MKVKRGPARETDAGDLVFEVVVPCGEKAAFFAAWAGFEVELGAVEKVRETAANPPPPPFCKGGSEEVMAPADGWREVEVGEKPPPQPPEKSEWMPWWIDWPVSLREVDDFCRWEDFWDYATAQWGRYRRPREKDELFAARYLCELTGRPSINHVSADDLRSVREKVEAWRQAHPVIPVDLAEPLLVSCDGFDEFDAGGAAMPAPEVLELVHNPIFQSYAVAMKRVEASEVPDSLQFAALYLQETVGRELARVAPGDLAPLWQQMEQWRRAKMGN